MKFDKSVVSFFVKGFVMKNVLLMLLAILGVATISAESAVAGGGGGAKKSSAISVDNLGGRTLGVIVDRDPTAAPAISDLATFQAAGGKILSPGKVGERFSVTAGNHTIYVFFVDAAGNVDVASGNSKQYTIGKGLTLNVKVTDNGVGVRAGLSP